MHASTLFTGSGYTLGRFECPPDADRWRAVDWIGPQAHVVLPETAVRIGVEHGEADVCTANEAIVYNRDTYYRRALVSPEGDRCTFLAVGGELADELRLPGNAPIHHRACPPAAYVAHRQAVARIHSDPLALDETLLTVLALIMGTPHQRTRSSTVDAVKALIAVDPVRRWRLAELAQAVHYSPYFLARMFRSHTGHSIARYRRDLCLRRSLPAALEPGADLSRVALRFGFSSHSHYTQAFGKAFGCTPSQARTASGFSVRQLLST
jgi:AraC-like DNA-binding protein